MSQVPPINIAQSEDFFSETWRRYQLRWQDRNRRMDRIDKAVLGQWETLDLEDEEQKAASPNLIQVALEDTAEAASLVPSVRVTPSKGTDLAKRRAAVMEQLGTSYLDASEIQLLTVKSMMDLAGYGMFSWVVTYSKEEGPRIERRDPRSCYPEPNYSTLGVTQRCFFARDVYVSQLHEDWQRKFLEHCAEREISPRHWVDNTVTLVEYYDAYETVVAATFDMGSIDKTMRPAEMGTVSVILEQVENPIGICPVVVGQRLSLDNEPRGQFDQVIQVLEAHVRLMSLVLDYSDQAVYSDVWVKDLIGEMPMGGGSYIQLGPGGDIGRVPPAVSSLSVYQEMESLINNVHLGGRWPKTRPGDIDQAIASGKFVESTVGMMNTVIRTYHLIMRRALEQALRVAFARDKKEGHDRTVSGVLRNQQFLLERDVKDIDLGAKVRAEYGLGLGRDPAQSMVLGLQASQGGIVSLEFVQENFEGVTDVQLERVRLDTEKLRDMMFGKLLEGVQTGEVPESALVEIYRARLNGEDIVELFYRYVVEPKEEMMAQMVGTGLGGPMMPGAPEQAGMMPPPPPSADSLLGALMGGPTGGEGDVEAINRTSVPTGPGSFSGIQTRG